MTAVIQDKECLAPPARVGSAASDVSVAERTCSASAQQQRRLVENLRRWLERQGAVRLIETHISYVLLTGRCAYKIKKAVDLGFLDFTTAARRRFYCEEEVRLNRRLAPALYLRVVPITGTVEAPRIDGAGAALDHAVEMQEFAQDTLLASMLERGALTPACIDALARVIASFHDDAACASPVSRFGRPERILECALENVASLRTLLDGIRDRERLVAIDRWTRHEHAVRNAGFESRRRAGYVRECHGDLHLDNIVLLGGDVVPFDCIEFNEDLRWIDVMSELAFAVMDLQARGHGSLGQRLLNAYLEITGDYAGLGVLRFYLVYRAMVRAKIAAIRASQALEPHVRASAQRQCSRYLGLALHYTFAGHPALIITHGFSGSGKTTLTQPLLEHIGAVRIRSDVERKRLHGFTAQDRTQSALRGGIYADASTNATYERLLALASTVVESGHVVIVDAAFLRGWQRACFAELARSRNLPFVILTFDAPVELLRERIRTRAQQGNDASEATLAVLDEQLRSQEPLTLRERTRELIVAASTSLEAASERSPWQEVIRALHRHQGHAMNGRWREKIVPSSGHQRDQSTRTRYSSRDGRTCNRPS